VQKVLTGDQRHLKLDASPPKSTVRPWSWKAKLAVALCSVWALLFGGLVLWRFSRRKKT
jgi:hypothetical protein